MRYLIAFLLLPTLALAQQPPEPTLPVPASIVNHTISYLAAGGTHAEGQALAEQLIALARQQVQAQRPVSAKPPADPAEPKAP